MVGKEITRNNSGVGLVGEDDWFRGVDVGRNGGRIFGLLADEGMESGKGSMIVGVEALPLAKTASLRRVGEVIEAESFMPDWIEEESEDERRYCLVESFTLGRQQMKKLQVFLKTAILEVRVGGVEGEIYPIGRQMLYHTLDLAQTLVAKQVLIEERLEKEGRVEVEIGDKKYLLKPDPFDLECLRAQIVGARSAFKSDVDDYRIIEFLDGALEGRSFRKPDKRSQALPDGIRDFKINNDY